MEENRGKGKKIVVVDQMQDMEAETQTRRPRTRGLKGRWSEKDSQFINMKN